MKACSRRNIIAVLIPAMLVVGIVACVWLYRLSAGSLNAIMKERLLCEPGIEQGRLFFSSLNYRLSIIDLYSERLSTVDWRDYTKALEEINLSAKEFGFSYVTVVGTDGIFYDKENEAVDISQYNFYLAAIDGQKNLEKSQIEDNTYFVFAVPYVVDKKIEGAVVGLFSEQGMLSLLDESSRGKDIPTLVFDSNGEIVAGTEEISIFKGYSNVYSVLKNLSTIGIIDSKSLETVKRDVEQGKTQNYSFLKISDAYLTYHPVDINGWYILRYVSSEYVNYEISHNKDGMKISFGLIFLLSVSLIVTVFIIVKIRRIELNREQHRSHDAVYKDSLTGLYNKKGFESITREHLLNLPEERICALVSFEVVSFRSYNALYGFEEGDELLKTIADIVRQFMKENDVAGRLYADHFVWFINGVTNEEIYETFRNAVRVSKDCGLPFFLCGGIYIIDDRQMPVSKMVDNASIAKDTIKYQFSTGIAIYNDSMLECQLEDAELIGSMMRGLENGEFVDYYQPKYNMNNDSITGAEALVRWKKPDGEIIMPGRFIELFEKNGFIRRLDFYMFERVCLMLQNAIINDNPVIPVSVNFSRVHLYDYRFPQRLHNIANKYGVDPKYIEIELTESAFLMEGEVLGQVVDKLHEYGFSVAIDDFGSGFSSLNMLKDVEVDTLKIDMKFLDGFERGGKVGTVVTSVIRMAKWLGIPVVAEGVETKEQIDFLRTLGCDMVQGYYYFRPVPRDDYENLLMQKETIFRVIDKPAAVTLESINAVLGGDSLVTSLVDGILGGFGLYELSEGRMEAIRVNRAYCEMMGYPDMASFSDHSINVFTQVYPPDLDAFIEACNKAVSTGLVQKFTARRYNYYGSLMQFKGFIKHIGGTETRPLICLSFLDATERMRAEREKELNKYSNALYGIFDEIAELNYTLNTYRLLSANRKRSFGEVQSLKEFERDWLNRIFPEDRKKIENLAAAARAEKLELPITIEYRVLVDGEVRWNTSSMVAVSGGSYLVCKLDVTKKKQYEQLVKEMEDLHHRVEFDVMTGVLNRVTAEALINEQIKKETADRVSALFLISLDNFKEINEKFGQPEGIAFVKEAASRIKSLLSEQDIVGRFTDDKFVVYMDGISNSYIAYTKALKIQDYISDIILPAMHPVNCSIGINIVYSDQNDYSEIISATEAALFEAQASTANKCVMYDAKENA